MSMNVYAHVRDDGGSPGEPREGQGLAELSLFYHRGKNNVAPLFFLF